MTAAGAVEREISGRSGSAAAKVYGSLDDLLERKPRTREHTIRGKTFILRELRQGESDAIQSASLRYVTGPDMKLQGTLDMNGNKARKAAYGLVRQDGTQVLPDPANDWVKLQEMFPDEIEQLAKVVDELSVTTEEARDAESKSSGSIRAAKA